MKKLIKNLFTEVDNNTWDISKILVTISILTGVALAIVALLYKNQIFSMNDYGMGMAALITSAAAIFHFKKDSNDTHSS